KRVANLQTSPMRVIGELPVKDQPIQVVCIQQNIECLILRRLSGHAFQVQRYSCSESLQVLLNCCNFNLAKFFQGLLLELASRTVSAGQMPAQSSQLVTSVSR